GPVLENNEILVGRPPATAFGQLQETRQQIGFQKGIVPLETVKRHQPRCIVRSKKHFVQAADKNFAFGIAQARPHSLPCNLHIYRVWPAVALPPAIPKRVGPMFVGLEGLLQHVQSPVEACLSQPSGTFGYWALPSLPENCSVVGLPHSCPYAVQLQPLVSV